MNNFEEFPEYGEESYTLTLGIDAVRLLHDHFDYSIEMWPGSPRRPAMEQEFLKLMKHHMFKIMTEHNFTHNTYNPDK